MVFNRSRVALAVVVASVALLAYVIFGGSDEDKILARLKELASAVETKTDETNIVLRTARINGVFKEGLDPMVVFSAPELQTQRGIRDLATLAGGAGQAFGEISLGIGATDIHVEGNLARAVSQVTLTGTRGGELRREERNVRFELRRWEGEWRVSAIDVAAKSEAQPEARP